MCVYPIYPNFFPYQINIIPPLKKKIPNAPLMQLGGWSFSARFLFLLRLEKNNNKKEKKKQQLETSKP